MEGTAAHIAQHAGKWQDVSVVIPVTKASTYIWLWTLAKPTPHILINKWPWSGGCVQLRANRQPHIEWHLSYVLIDFLSKFEKEVEPNPEHTSDCVRSHHTASELAWDTDTIMCAHEDMAESYVQLEKIVAFGRMVSGRWKTLFIQSNRAYTAKLNFLFLSLENWESGPH